MDWGPGTWARLQQSVHRKILRAASEADAFCIIVRAARSVLRAYSSSFFLVTRFLPPVKRAEVEVVYAAVRYPDEVVDSFPWPADCKLARLNDWELHYRSALQAGGIKQQIQAGIPWILAGFARVVSHRGIPPEHYLAFLDAMRRDARPAIFADFDELIRSYVYGSAVVVGYFLTHIYGTADGTSLEQALGCARELGIALQLTNFARDGEEDRRQGRVYIPLDALSRAGFRLEEFLRCGNPEALRTATRWLAEQAEPRYLYARLHLPAFSADCRTAIHACIDVYQAINRRLLDGGASAGRRVRLNAFEKFRMLPPGKYWRVPLAYARLV